MRTLVLVSLTIFALTLGFLAYWWNQPADKGRAKRAARDEAPLKLKPRQTDKPYGPGKGIWVVKFDEETAQPISRFRGEEYTPRPDGWLDVVKPQAQFFMKGARASTPGEPAGARLTRVLTIQGERGEIYRDDPAKKTGMSAMAGSQETPSRGRLHNVVIHLYENLADPQAELDRKPRPRPSMTITLNNASFDNQAFKIYSEGYKQGKTRVEADQVPVLLTSDDYDFVGRGLTIRWNERDRRLQFLEIRHGDTLTLKHPRSFMNRQSSPRAPLVADAQAMAMAPVEAMPTGRWGDGEMGSGRLPGAVWGAWPDPLRGMVRVDDWRRPLPAMLASVEREAVALAAAQGAAAPGAAAGGEGPGEAPATGSRRSPKRIAAERAAATQQAATRPAAAASAPPQGAAAAPSAAAEGGKSARRPRGPIPKPQIRPNTDPPLYRATFHDDVRITQGQDLLITARKMSIDFLLQDETDDADARGAATTAPTTRPAGPATTQAATQAAGAKRSPKRAAADRAATTRQSATPASQAVATTQPAQRKHRKGTAVAATMPSSAPTTRPAMARGGATTRPALNPATNPATQPAEPEVPVIVKWTGPLVVEPLVVGSESPLRAGQAVMRLEGQPVNVRQGTSTIAAGTLTYRTEDQLVLLTPVGPDRPIEMRDARGAVVRTARMDFSNPKRQAVLYGASNAVFPQEDEAGKPQPPLLARWDKSCTLHFAEAAKAPGGAPPAPAGGLGLGGDGSDMNIERAELDGNVYVEHPQLRLASQTLDLAFETAPAGGKAGATTRATTQPATRPADDDGRRLEVLRAQRAKRAAEAAEYEAGVRTQRERLAAMGDSALLRQRTADLDRQADALTPRMQEVHRVMANLQASGMKPGAALVEEWKQLQAEQDRLRKEADKARGELRAQREAQAAIEELERKQHDAALEVSELDRRIAESAALVAAHPATRPATRATTRPAPRSNLRQVIASGAVHAVMIDADKTQTIDCTRLTLQTATTPDGRFYPRTVNADGDVRTVDDQQELRAGHLAVTLRPSTRPTTRPAVALATTRPTTQGVAGGKSLDGETAKAELQSLIAHNNVKVIGKDGTVATADQLLVENRDGRNDVKLLGQPASIADPKSAVYGPIIQIFPDDQRLEVVGAGRMRGTQQEKPGEAPRPVDVTWQRGLSVSGSANRVNIAGGVVAVMKEADGSVSTARGDRVEMTLADAAPTTKPTTQATGQGGAVATTQATAGAATRAATQPTTQMAKKKDASNPYGAMGSKTIRQVNFYENTQITTVLENEVGEILRRMHLEAARLEYDMANRRLLIPVEGRMVVEDHRPAGDGKKPTTQASGVATTAPAGAAVAAGGVKPAAGGTNPLGGDNRGATAFKWTRQMTYDDATRVAIMDGDMANPVIVAHRDDTPDAKTYRLVGDRVVAEMEQAPAKATTQPAGAGAPGTGAAGPATTGPATKPAEAKVQLKRVTAIGHLTFTGPDVEVGAHTIVYDPKTQVITARGDGRNAVSFTIASDPAGRKEAEEIIYDLAQGKLIGATKVNVRMGR